MTFFNKQPKQEVCNHKVCYKCGHLFETGGKEVSVFSSYRELLNKQTYCKNCVPKYDFIEIYMFIPDKYFRHQPNIEVDKNGKPIKKK